MVKAVSFATGRRSTLLAVAGIAVDRLLGEPPARWHPVARFGQAMGWLEVRCYSDRRAAGTAYAAAGVSGALAAGLVAERLAGGWANAAATYTAVAGRALADAARQVSGSLAGGDLEAARRHVTALVGRDPDGLDAPELARAVIESVAENTVDAVVAPSVWAAAGGAPAVLAYRAINTLDAMVGHRSPRYARFGWAAARLDDCANWVPARVTALLVAAVRPRAAVRVGRAVRRQAGAHPSPNAGVAEAAFAAALGLRLGGVNRYDGRSERRPQLGTGRPATGADIERAVRLSGDVTAALAISLAGAALVAAWRRGS
jgi:adenosylcobinamide-phosphate synthase